MCVIFDFFVLRFFFFFIKALLFSEEKIVFFTAKLRRGYRDFPYILRLHMCVVSPIIDLPHPSGTCITVDDVTLIHNHHPKFTVYMRVSFLGLYIL